LRERVASDRQVLTRLTEETAQLEITIARATSAITALVAEQHRHEKDVVAHAAQLSRSNEESLRVARKSEVIALERGRAEEERRMLEGRRSEAESSISRIGEEQRQADDRLTAAQRQLGDARDAVSQLSARTAEVRASHAALVERASAIAAEVER